MTDFADLTTMHVSQREHLRGLNNRHEKETSFLTAPAWDQLIAQSSLAISTHDQCAFLIGFDQSAQYQNANFAWFSERNKRFFYVDRIIVDSNQQAKGSGRALYDHVIKHAITHSLDRIVCEINSNPPNPKSDAFHERLGFVAVGTAQLAGGEKQVRYMSKELT